MKILMTHIYVQSKGLITNEARIGQSGITDANIPRKRLPYLEVEYDIQVNDFNKKTIGSEV